MYIIHYLLLIVAIPTPKAGDKRKDVPAATSDHKGIQQYL